MTNFAQLLAALIDAGVDFVIIGGVAASAHGALRTTLDLDIVYSREPPNLARLADALGPFAPYPRGAPEGLPFQWDAQSLGLGLNFTLTTKLGDIDLLGEITAGGGYDRLVQHSIVLTLFDRQCRCLDLDELIRVKRAAGRPKDFEAIAELTLLRELGKSD